MLLAWLTCVGSLLSSGGAALSSCSGTSDLLFTELESTAKEEEEEEESSLPVGFYAFKGRTENRERTEERISEFPFLTVGLVPDIKSVKASVG